MGKTYRSSFSATAGSLKRFELKKKNACIGGCDLEEEALSDALRGLPAVYRLPIICSSLHFTSRQPIPQLGILHRPTLRNTC